MSELNSSSLIQIEWSRARGSEQIAEREFSKIRKVLKARLTESPADPACKVFLGVRHLGTNEITCILEDSRLPVISNAVAARLFATKGIKVEKVRIGWPEIPNERPFEVEDGTPDGLLESFVTYEEALSFAKAYVQLHSDSLPQIYRGDEGAKRLVRHRPYLGCSRQFGEFQTDPTIPIQ